MLVICIRIFNTNNLWVSLRAIQYVVKNHALRMEIIVNPKVCLITIRFVAWQCNYYRAAAMPAVFYNQMSVRLSNA